MSSNNPPAVHKNELVRQRSLSHEQSPSRPRRQTEVPQPMVRSSSDTNLMAMDEKKGEWDIKKRFSFFYLKIDYTVKEEGQGS